MNNLPSQIKDTQNIFSNDIEFKWKKNFLFEIMFFSMECR